MTIISSIQSSTRKGGRRHYSQNRSTFVQLFKIAKLI